MADLTYVHLPEGEVFLACLLDAYSRKCIGGSLARRMESSLPLQALEMALAQREARSWADSPFRPRAAIVQFRLRQSVAERGHPDQYVRTRTTHGERAHGKFL